MARCQHISKDSAATIRILRATGNQSRDTIKELAKQSPQGYPSLFTLWIREEAPMCGRFNPPRPGQSLVQGLLDSRPLNRANMEIEDLLMRVAMGDRGDLPRGILHQPFR